MASVEIEGSLTPAAGVAKRGERKIVAHTERIDRLVRGGFIKIVRFIDDETGTSQPVDVPADGVIKTPVDGDTLKAEAPEAEGEWGQTLPEPKGNSSKADWQAFLTQQRVQFPEDANRDQLANAWETIQQQKAQLQQ